MGAKLARKLIATLALSAAFANAAQAHDGIKHATPDEAAAHRATTAKDIPANTPGFPDIKGGDFRLTTHLGQARTARDPDGRFQLLFFGYAQCQAICSVALPRMAETVRTLDARGVKVTPVLITVDESRDTVSALAKAVGKIHPRLVGLTGDAKALEQAYAAFQVEKKKVFDHPEHGAIYAHGSYIYVLGPDGTFQTLLPPVLGSDRMADIVASYAKAAPDAPIAN